MTDQHPPVAAGVIAIDFDATLWQWGDLECLTSEPMPGAVEAAKAIKAAGYRIVIFTSRYSPTWWRDEAQRRALTVQAFAANQRRSVQNALARAGVPYDLITCEKVPAQYYVDDKAIAFKGDWSAVLKELGIE